MFAAALHATFPQVVSSPLWAATATPAPQLPPTNSPQELATALTTLSAAARKLLSSLATHAALPPTPAAAQQQAELVGAVEAMEVAGAAARAPFAWVDGPLVVAMRRGDLLLVDEVNLAEDAVLERLNRWVGG
jgi:midasin